MLHEIAILRATSAKQCLLASEMIRDELADFNMLWHFTIFHRTAGASDLLSNFVEVLMLGGVCLP